MTSQRGASTDPRAERVRTALLQAGFDLLLERRIDEVTVPDLVAQAQVSRPVFYKHFADRDDLVGTSLVLRMDEAVAGSADAAEATRRVLAWADTNRVLYGNLHPSVVAQRVSDHLRALVRPWCQELVGSARPRWSDADRRDAEQFVVGGLLELVRTAVSATPPRRIDAERVMRLTARLARSR